MKIGITGNTGSGKSTVTKMLWERLDALTIDVDRLGHWMIASSPVKDRILAEFPGEIKCNNGNIIRGELAKLVFSDADKFKRLDDITRPALIDRLTAMMSLANEKDNLIVDCALLCEWGLLDLFDTTIFVAADEDVRVKRLISSRGLSEDRATKQVAFQTKQESKICLVDIVINNNGNIGELVLEVDNKLGALFEK